jgi:hypothetical protein
LPLRRLTRRGEASTVSVVVLVYIVRIHDQITYGEWVRGSQCVRRGSRGSSGGLLG